MGKVEGAWFKGVNIVFDPSPSTLASGVIYVGVSPTDCRPGIARVGDAGTALVLSHKNPADGVRSGVRFLSRLDRDLVRGFLSTDPREPLAGRTIVVEDASPDTCLSVVALAMAARGETLSETWLDYADRWEEGDTDTTGAPTGSFGALLSSLVHAEFRPAADERGPLSNDALGAALTLGVAFTDACVRDGQDPQNLMPSARLGSLLSRARAHLDADRDLARAVVNSAIRVEVALEIAQSRRRRVVDALIFTEDRSDRLVKSFLRTMPGAPRGEGYPVLCMYRPDGEAGGNDIVFSVNPGLELWMRREWASLEVAEDAAWIAGGETRPRETPRNGMLSWIDGHAGPELSPSEQPWWEGRPLYTMIAAPKRLRDGRPGSRLSWSEALHAFWRSACQVSAFDLRNAMTDDKVDIFAAPAGADAASSRLSLIAPEKAQSPQIFLSHLKVGVDADGTLVDWNDTVARTFAAYLAAGQARVDRLPGADDYAHFVGRGLGVVITHHGVVLVEMTSEGAATAAQVKPSILRARSLLESARTLAGEVQGAREETVTAVATADPAKKRRALAHQFAILSSALQDASRPPLRSADPFVAKLESVIENYWDAESLLKAVIAEVTQLRDMTSSASDAVTNESINALTRFGFPFALTINLFAFALTDWKLLRGGASGGVFDGLHPLALAAWALTALLICAIIIALVFAGQKRWERQLRALQSRLDRGAGKVSPPR